MSWLYHSPVTFTYLIVSSIYSVSSAFSDIGKKDVANTLAVKKLVRSSQSRVLSSTLPVHWWHEAEVIFFGEQLVL